MTGDVRGPTLSADLVRRVAIGLVLYGALGLVLVAVALVGGSSGIARIDAAAGSVAEASETLEAVGDAFAGFDTSLESAAKSASDAAAASRNASSTATRLADAMGVSIFGAQPLLSLATDFRRQATDLRDVAEDLDELGGSLARDRDDVRRIRDHVRVLSARLGAFGSPTGGAGTAVLLVALLLWLGVQALATLVVGIVLLRRRPHRRA